MDSVYFYDVDIKWLEDRKGVMSSSVLNEKIEVATPPEFARGIEGVWSPEHLLVGAANSCLMTTFLAIAENSKLEFVKFESRAKGRLQKVDGKLMIDEITLMPHLTIANEADREKALRILQKSEAACLISNSLKATIVFTPEIQVKSVLADI